MRLKVRVHEDSGGRLMTKQSMAAETDINNIVARHVSHNVPFPSGLGSYGDFSDFDSYHFAVNRVRAADAAFAALPAAVRDKCGNDVGKFLDMVGAAESRADLVALGLVAEAVPDALKPPVVAPDPALPVSPTP